MSYGEDEDLRRRISCHNFSEELADYTEKRKVVSTWKEVFKQGEWYGKSYLKFVKKHPKEILSVVFSLYFFSLPLFVILSFFSIYAFLTLILEMIFFIYLCLESYRLGDSRYALFIPFVRLVRSMGLALGIVEGLFTEDLGKSS